MDFTYSELRSVERWLSIEIESLETRLRCVGQNEGFRYVLTAERDSLLIYRTLVRTQLEALNEVQVKEAIEKREGK